MLAQKKKNEANIKSRANGKWSFIIYFLCFSVCLKFFINKRKERKGEKGMRQKEDREEGRKRGRGEGMEWDGMGWKEKGNPCPSETHCQVREIDSKQVSKTGSIWADAEYFREKHRRGLENNNPAWQREFYFKSSGQGRCRSRAGPSSPRSWAWVLPESVSNCLPSGRVTAKATGLRNLRIMHSRHIPQFKIQTGREGNLFWD